MESRGPIILGVLVVLIGVIGVVVFWWNLGNHMGYSPEQPIPFSHKLHAGDNKIPCMYCHSSVDKSAHATVPSMDTCMNCHRVVKTESPLIQKITKLYENNEAIAWVKVHDMPDFVFFNHKRHIARGIDCTACHGAVATMDQIEQVKPLNMGFCVNCHRRPEYNAPIDCDACHR